MSLIQVNQVTKNYRWEKTLTPALAQVSLAIGPGERVCLMGPSGSGKSTLLNLIGGIDKLDEGQILVAGQDLGQLKDGKLSDFRNRTLGFVFQSFNLIPVLSVYENVEYPLLLQNLTAKERKARVEALLQAVGLFEMRRRGPESLSGGQRQRVAIARGLVTEPQILLADEPTAALDHKTGTAIMELMAELNQTRGTTLVFSTHDSVVASYAPRVVKMLDGKVLEDLGPGVQG